MPDDDVRNGLRIGGWLPPYPERSGYPGDHDHPDATLVPYRGSPLVPVGPEARPRRVLLVCAVAVAAGAAGMLALVYPAHNDNQNPPLAERMVFPTPPEPSAAISMLPAPATATSGSAAAGTRPGGGGAVPRTTAVSTDLPATHPAKPGGVTHTVSPAPSVTTLKVGATIGLELADRSGFRVRHRNFVARVDPISSSSSALDKADSSFVVRTGLGRAGCYSFESVNYPGYYLRHRNFILRLDRRDGSPLFEQDATFCPSVTAGGTAITLGSINYPGRALDLGGDNLIHLDRGQGTAFKVRPAA